MASNSQTDLYKGILAVMLSVVVIAFPEEAIKYFWCTSVLSGAPQERLIADVIYAASSSLGFATGQALLYTVESVSNVNEINSEAFYLSLALILFLLPLHVLTGYQIGLKMTIMDFYRSHPDDPTYTRPGCLERSVMGILCVPVILRSILNSVFFCLVFLP